MPSYSAFNSSDAPLFTDSANTFSNAEVTSPSASDASAAGNLFTATASNSDSLGILGGTVTIALQVTNSSATKTMYVATISGGAGALVSLLSSFSGNFMLTKNGTLTTPVTLTPVNMNFGNAATSAMTAQSSTSAVTGGTPFEAVQLAGMNFLVDCAGSIVVPPGSSVTITVSASLSVAGLLSTSANISWWE